MASFPKKIEWIFTFVVAATVNTTAKTLSLFWRLPLLLVYMKVTHKSPVILQVLVHRLLWALKIATLKVSDFRTEIKFLRLELTRIVKSSRVVCTPVRQRENIERAFMVVITL